MVVTFVRVTTGDLGSDGDYDPGDMGAMYGSFFTNDSRIEFNGRDDDLGFNHNSHYNISDLMANYGSGSSRLEIELPPGNPAVIERALTLGFDLWDEDTGWHHPNHSVCSGDTAIYDDDLTASYSGVIETDMPASGRRTKSMYNRLYG